MSATPENANGRMRLIYERDTWKAAAEKFRAERDAAREALKQLANNKLSDDNCASTVQLSSQRSL